MALLSSCVLLTIIEDFVSARNVGGSVFCTSELGVVVVKLLVVVSYFPVFHSQTCTRVLEAAPILGSSWF